MIPKFLKSHNPVNLLICVILFKYFICTPLWAADSFPPLVPEGEQVANSPEELEKLIQDSIASFGGIKSITYNPDGQSLTSVSWDNTVRVWNIATGKELKHLQKHIDKVNSSVAHSPDGQQRASGSSETVQILDVATGQELIRLKGHTNRVTSVAYSLDGQQLASGSSDNTVQRFIEATDVETAFDSQAVETAFADWGELVGPLARIIVYATIEQAPFTFKTLLQQLNAGKITYQVEEVKQALTRLELSFIINRQKDQYSYRVPLFCDMLKRQGPQEMLQEELKNF